VGYVRSTDSPKMDSTPASQTLHRVTDLHDAQLQFDRDREPLILETAGLRLVVMPPDVFDRLVEGIHELVAKDLRLLEPNRDELPTRKAPDPTSWRKVREVLDAARDELAKIDSEK
jgi:hypothetical protein